MGEPEPLDLELLKHGDNDEICRAIRELELVSLAEGLVYSVIGNRYHAERRVLAIESIKLLFTVSIQTCHTIDAIRPMLATIAKRRAINFLNVAYRKWEIQFGGKLPGIIERPAAPGVNPVEVLGDILAEGLGIDAFQLGPFVGKVLAEAGLDDFEKHLLSEHVVDYCTQQEFSNRHGIALNVIGRRKDRLIAKIRTWLTGELSAKSRAEFLRRLRENRERRKNEKKRRKRQPPLI